MTGSPDSSSHPTTSLRLLIDAAAGLFLAAGLWTPIAGGVAAIIGLWGAFWRSGDPWSHNTIGNIGRWAGYARTWHLVRRCPPLWKKAHQTSGPVDCPPSLPITLKQYSKAILSSESRPLYPVSEQARF